MAVWGLSSKVFRRHIKANSVSSKLVVNSAYNPLKTPVNQGGFEIIIEFINKSLQKNQLCFIQRRCENKWQFSFKKYIDTDNIIELDI